MKALLLKDLAKAKDYSIKVASAMPEAQLDFKPAPESMSFRELIHHMAYSLLWMDKNCMQNVEDTWAPPAVPASAKQLTNYLRDSFDTVAVNIAAVDQPGETYIAAFYFMIEHNAHHRGQAVTYLRCCAVEPPAFPF